MTPIDDSWYDDLLADVTTPTPAYLRDAVQQLVGDDHTLAPIAKPDRRRRWLAAAMVAATLVLGAAGIVLLTGDGTPSIAPADTVPAPTSQLPPTSTTPSPTSTDPAASAVPAPTTTASSPATTGPPAATTPAVPGARSPRIPVGSTATPFWLFSWQDGFLAGARDGRFIDAALGDGVGEWSYRRIELPDEIGILFSATVASDRFVLASTRADGGGTRLIVASSLDLDTWEVDEIATTVQDLSVDSIAVIEAGWMTTFDSGQGVPESWFTPWDGEPRQISAPPDAWTISLGDRLLRETGGQIEISSNGIDWTQVDLPLTFPLRGMHGEPNDIISMPNAAGSAVLESGNSAARSVGVIREDGTWQSLDVPGLPERFFRNGVFGAFEPDNPTSATIITAIEDEQWWEYLIATDGTNWLVEQLPERQFSVDLTVANGGTVLATTPDGDWLMLEFP